MSYANVVATLCLFLLLGGGAYAAKRLPRNSVGAEQLKRNAVTKQKVRKNAISTPKIVKNAVTGAKVNEATLGTVPSAQTANTANAANTAGVANSLAPAEGWHEVGAAGEPGFLNGWKNEAPPGPPEPETVAFYKDHEGVVHLKGVATEGTQQTTVFQLPVGYRPASRMSQRFVGVCTACANLTVYIQIYGSDTGGRDGMVFVANGTQASFDGITFRAES